MNNQKCNPLTFVYEAVLRILKDDSLVVIDPGLGIHTILLEFLRQFHIQNGCHPGSRKQTTRNLITTMNVSGNTGTTEKKKIRQRIGRLVGAPSGAEHETIETAVESRTIETALESREINQARKRNRQEEEKQKTRGSRLIFLLNTNEEEARVIRKRAELMGLLYDESKTNRGSKKRKLLSDEDHNSRVFHETSDSSNNPFIDESPILLSFNIYAPSSSQLDNPEQRQAEYSKGGLFIVKSRLLVTDILTGRLPPESIDGIIVNHAETLLKEWNNPFVLHLFRQRNHLGFIKAFSDTPEAFGKTSSSLEHVMKMMLLKIVHLFPRYHSTVEFDLRSSVQPATDELAPKLTPALEQIQKSLMGLLNKCLIEIKKIRRVDLSEFTLEDACFKSAFTYKLQDRLDSIWAELPLDRRRYVQDIKTFRDMLSNCIKLEAVSFYLYIENIKRAKQISPGWFIDSEWLNMAKKAKERLFRIERIPSELSCPEASENNILNVVPGRLVLSIDVPTKWPLLMEAVKNSGKCLNGSALGRLKLDDIGKIARHVKNIDGDSECDYEAEDGSPEIQDHEEPEDDSANASQTNEENPRLRILIVANEYQAHKLEQVLLLGPKKAMLLAFKHFLRKEAEDRKKALMRITGGSGSGTEWTPESVCSPIMSNQLLESVLLIKQYEEFSRMDIEQKGHGLRLMNNPIEFNEEMNDFMESLNLPIKPFVKVIVSQDLERKQNNGKFELELRLFRPQHIILMEPDVAKIRAIEVYAAELSARAFLRIHTVKSKKNFAHTDLQIKEEHLDDTDDIESEDHNVELSESERNEVPFLFGSEIHVTIMVSQKTREHQQYLYAMQAERQAWESLIQRKQHLVVPMNESIIVDDDCFTDLVSGGRTYEKNTRKAGGQIERGNRPSVVVDMREFNSKLPFQIYCKGMDIVPVTLTVGDYVLSRDICVERKEMKDFVSSLRSGRLFEQASVMTRVYRDPTLLIEWMSQKKGSPLESREAIGMDDRDNTNLIGRLCLLILQFPQLRLIWSPKLPFTADIFRNLKIGREGPDPFRAVLMGAEFVAPMDPVLSGIPSLDTALRESTILAIECGTRDEDQDKQGQPKRNSPNEQLMEKESEQSSSSGRLMAIVPAASENYYAVDMLRKLPGITHKNLPIILSHISTIADLVSMEPQCLKQLIGESCSHDLLTFLNQEFWELNAT